MLQWPIVTIDFEASALSRYSYPIEVGVCVWRAPEQPIAGWSALIRPVQVWIEEGDWNDRSAAVHNIPREALHTGLDPAAAVTALNEILGAGTVAWCDGGAADAFWLRALADAARIETTFEIADWALGAQFDQFACMRALRWLERTQPRHRARDDAERLIKAIARGFGLRHGTSIDLLA